MASLARKFRFTQRDLDRLPPCPAESASKAYEVSDTEVTGLEACQAAASDRPRVWETCIFDVNPISLTPLVDCKRLRAVIAPTKK